MKLSAETIERFWAKVCRTETCWLWTGSRMKHGYGHFRISQPRSMIYSHRLSFMLHNDVDIRGRVVRHTCDVPACVNPAHLVLGTQNDNVQDMIRRNRGAKGTAVGKLLPAQVREIRARLQAGERQQDIAKDYNISRPAISVIKSRKVWGWLT